MSNKQEYQIVPRGIKETTKHIASMFHRVSGLPDLEEKICSYYCLSTWFIPQINPFPILSVTGPNGTGKSQLLATLNRLAFSPYCFTASEMSYPTIRDELGKAHEKVAIVEEADKDALESLLNLRYMRETAVCAKKVPGGLGVWRTIYIPIFGPTVVHKRLPFKDPALDGRSIIINTIPNTQRRYIRSENLEEEEISDIVLAQGKLKVSVKIPQNPYIPEDIAPRIADSYRPLIALASIEEDKDFLEPLWERLLMATRDLADGQSYEPGPIVVQALLSALTNEKEEIVIRNVKIEGELVKKIQYEFGHNLNNRQVAKILRGYGFQLRRIGGGYRIIPDINTLVKVTKAIGLEDEALERAAKGLVRNPWELE